MKLTDEAQITVNGQLLTVGQSMTLRVALSRFHSDMSEDMPLGDDEHGKFMANAYRERSYEILRMIFMQNNS